MCYVYALTHLSTKKLISLLSMLYKQKIHFAMGDASNGVVLAIWIRNGVVYLSKFNRNNQIKRLSLISLIYFVIFWPLLYVFCYYKRLSLFF